MSCNSCIQVSLPACPDQIVVNGNLDPNTQYRYEITDKFQHIYNGITTTDANGLLAINIVDDPNIPKGMFMSFSGAFILKAYKFINVYQIEDAQFNINSVNYDCAELRFSDYYPSISYFDPEAPVYVPPIASPIIVEFTDQTEVVVNHVLGYKPFITILDTGDNVIGGNVVHNSNAQFTVTFDSPMSGTIQYR